jgi:hypothetical protein
MTGLHLAAREGQCVVLSQLMTATYVDVNVKDTWGLTPLDHAVECRQWACTVMLISQGGMATLLKKMTSPNHFLVVCLRLHAEAVARLHLSHPLTSHLVMHVKRACQHAGHITVLVASHLVRIRVSCSTCYVANYHRSVSTVLG